MTMHMDDIMTSVCMDGTMSLYCTWMTRWNLCAWMTQCRQCAKMTGWLLVHGWHDDDHAHGWHYDISVHGWHNVVVLHMDDTMTLVRMDDTMTTVYTDDMMNTGSKWCLQSLTFTVLKELWQIEELWNEFLSVSDRLHCYQLIASLKTVKRSVWHVKVIIYNTSTHTLLSAIFHSFSLTKWQNAIFWHSNWLLKIQCQSLSN